MSRLTDLDRLYESLDRLESGLGQRSVLSECHRRMPWPNRGVYLFFEPDEFREASARPRIVRVGTHALTDGSRSTLWQRLAQHRGTRRVAGGNHRGSIFRLLVGAAIAVQNPALACPSWGCGTSAGRSIREGERTLEAAVSAYLGKMTVLSLPLDDAPGRNSLRGYIERNAIALVSNFQRPAVDPPSENWLGYSCPRERVRISGLWNSNHVDEDYDPGFLSVLEQIIEGFQRGEGYQRTANPGCSS